MEYTVRRNRDQLSRLFC